MFSKSYQLLPQRDPTGPKTPGLFVDAEGFTQQGYRGGVSFDSMPNVSPHGFTGMRCLQSHWQQLKKRFVLVHLTLEI